MRLGCLVWLNPRKGTRASVCFWGSALDGFACVCFWGSQSQYVSERVRTKFVSLSLSPSQYVSGGVRSKFACADLLSGLAFFEARVPCMAFMALTSAQGKKRGKSYIRTYVFRGSGALFEARVPCFSGSHICRSVDNQLYFCSKASKLRSGCTRLVRPSHLQMPRKSATNVWGCKLLMYDAFSF